MKRCRPILTAFALALLAPVAIVAEGQVISAAERQSPPEVGDKAPPLQIERWVNGEGVDTSTLEGPYVVVFNITACPSCRKALPYLGGLSKTYGQNIPIINVFANELPAPNDPRDVASVEKVRSLLSALDGIGDMPVGVDGPERTISAQWGIWAFPSAYLIRGGKVAWIGDPTWIEPVLANVQTGTFDAQAARDEQAAYEARKAEARTALSEENYDRALAITDMLIAEHPQESSLYFEKYEFLLEAGRSDEADRFLQWLIDSDPERFDWDHFVPLTYLYPDKPNYALSLSATDRAIAHARWDLAVASLLSWKAKIYLDRHDAGQGDGGRGDIQQAIGALEKALAISKTSGDRNDERRFEAELAYFQFRLWAGVDDNRANDALKSVLMQEAPRVDWSKYVKDALHYQQTPDYALLLWAADRAMIEAFDEAMEADALASKAEIYAARHNYEDAVSLYEKAIEKARFTTRQDALSTYEAALSELRNKL